jgi:hypothetical protein
MVVKSLGRIIIPVLILFLLVWNSNRAKEEDEEPGLLQEQALPDSIGGEMEQEIPDSIDTLGVHRSPEDLELRAP